MTGPDHYYEAERLLAKAQITTDHFNGEQDAMPTLLAAAVHAILANAATGTAGPGAAGTGTSLPVFPDPESELVPTRPGTDED
jgi:hypothetical protein